MNRIEIITDSNSGITQNEGKELGIVVVPMPFTINGEEYLEDITLTQEKFYEFLKDDNAVVSTSQPSIAYVEELWANALENNDSVIYIPMSSGLSNSCETALRAAQKPEFQGKVFVVDNKRISVTQRQSVLDAMKLRDLGYTGKEIHDILIETMSNSDIYITVATLKYLKKGGRITPAAAALGTMLKLKPILQIEGEKLDKYKMRNRTMENAIEIMMDACEENINGYLKDLDGRTDNVYLAVAYSGTDKELPMKFAEMIKERFDVSDVVVNPLSLSVSCHIGDGALALAVTKELPEKYLKK
jgi:DegV family protein with EDD domain